MSFFTTAVSTMSTLVVALGGGVGVWGVVNLMEGYGADNPASKSQGVKQLMAGGRHYASRPESGSAAVQPDYRLIGTGSGLCKA